ncbi:unnamed protein product, partial [Mesorhabditis spiculigera]
MLLLIVASALLASSTVLGQKCDPIRFDQCQQTFARIIGADPSVDWKKPRDLHAAIQNVYINGLDATTPGIVSVCNAYNAFMQCIRDDGYSYQDCFSANWLLSLNSSIVTPYDTYYYVGVMVQVSYQCSAGFYPAVDNWPCIQSVYKNQGAALDKCLQTFYINAQGNPYRACEFFKDGMECYQGTFRHCRDEVMYWGCESFRSQAHIGYEGCKQSCQVNQFFGDVKPEQKMKLVDSERYTKNAAEQIEA